MQGTLKKIKREWVSGIYKVYYRGTVSSKLSAPGTKVHQPHTDSWGSITVTCNRLLFD